jgi:hypothetical protein
MKKPISTELTSANIASILDLLADAPKKLEALSRHLSAEQLRGPLGSGERSFTEDLAHMIHVEAQSSEMIYQALLTDEPFFANVHPERDLGKLLRFDLLDFSELLVYYKTRRKVLLRVLSGLTEAQWTRTIREKGKKRKESVYWRARTVVMHELDHLGDLERKIK